MESKITTKHPDLQKHIKFLQNAVNEHDQNDLIQVLLTPGIISFLFELLEWNPADTCNDLELVFDIATFQRESEFLHSHVEIAALSTQKKVYKAFTLVSDLNVR
jgi:hypothetical protein